MMYLVAAVAACGIFVAAGWRSKHARSTAAAHGRVGLPVDTLWGEDAIDVDASDAPADVGIAIRLALKRLAPVMANQALQAEIAAPSGLFVQMRSAALADLLEELLAAVIHSAPACRLLITATTHGDHIFVGMTDDMLGVDSEVRQGSIRSLKERVALRGGDLDINVRPTEGTTMTLRLIAAAEQGWPPPEPATRISGPTSALSVRAEP
jgi:hypothetical protein